MAWEDFQYDGISGVSGDKAFDEFALALSRLAKIYEDRFSRKPTMNELLYAFGKVVRSAPHKYVSDPAGLRFSHLHLSRDFERERDFVDVSLYEGTFVEEPLPGYYTVDRRRQPGGGPSTSVIKVPTLEVRGRTLVCEYEILSNDISDKAAEKLIVRAILVDLSGNHFRGSADEINFKNLGTGVSWTVPYPR